MADTMAGLFGPTPEEVRAAQMQAYQQQAQQYGRMDPFEQANTGMFTSGARIGDLIARATGGVNVAQQRAQQQQEAMRGLDTTTPEGLLQYAVKLKDINPAMAAQAVAAARKLASDIADEKYKTAHAAQLGALAKKQEAEAAAKEKEDGLKNLPPEVQAMLKLQTMDPTSPGYTQLKAWLDKKMEGKGDWSEPFDLAGATVQKNLQTGEIRTAVARPPVTKVSVGGAGGTKPRNLSREAGLKWELDNGMIDQATYDAAISSTPGGVLRQKQTDAIATAEAGFSAVERNINQLFDPNSGKLKPAAQPLFGQYAQYRPEASMPQSTVDAKLALEGLTDQVMMANLADAKARVGQSFGSMQVQEWDKFTQQLTSLKRGLSEKQAAESLKYVADFIKNKRAILNKALNTQNVIQSDRTPPSQTGGNRQFKILGKE